MNIEIWPYTLTRRTEYSKIHIYDVIKNKEIYDYAFDIADEITANYKTQTLHKDEFFEIKDTTLVGVKNVVRKEKIKYLFIPDEIKVIENAALIGIDAELISLPNTLRKIGANAFYNCKSLKYINIPDSVKEIGDYTFYECVNLEKVKLPSNLYKLEFGTFSKCYSLDNVYIPDGVHEIAHYAFDNCKSLKNIRLSNNLELIDNGAFMCCDKLSKIDLPETLKQIGQLCFYECKSLEKIIIPDNVNAIQPRTFVNCENLEYVKLPKNLIVLSEGIFTNCRKLKSVILQDNISKLQSEAFNETKQLKSITVPKKLNHSEGVPFYKSGIKTLIFNHDLEDLYNIPFKYDFIYNSNIDKIVISKNVNIITPDAFKYSGSQIKQIDYIGTKEEFEEFKNKNKKLFNILPNAKVNFVENIIEKDVEIEDITR